MNVSISYFYGEDEIDSLIGMFNKAYELSIDNEDGIILVYINLTGEYDKITIDDLTYPIHFSSYSEYNNYTFEELEEQLCLVYNEFYSKGIYYNPLVIMIHDASNMCDDNDEYELITYLNNKLTLLEVMRVFIFCTIRDK